jgi:DNA polymerase-3 subunit epsilon
MLFEINKCGAPCIGNQSIAAYSEITAKYRNLLEVDFREIHETSNIKMAEHSLNENFEEAIEIRDRYAHLLRAASRIERLNSIAKLPNLVVAKANGDSWEFASIKFGRLAATNISSATTSVASALDALYLLSENVPNEGFLQLVNHEEVELILNYLESGGIRIVRVEGEYSFPTFGPNSQQARIGNYDFAIA